MIETKNYFVSTSSSFPCHLFGIVGRVDMQNWAIPITYSHFDLIDCWLCKHSNTWMCLFCSPVLSLFRSSCPCISFIPFGSLLPLLRFFLVIRFGYDVDHNHLFAIDEQNTHCHRLTHTHTAHISLLPSNVNNVNTIVAEEDDAGVENEKRKNYCAEHCAFNATCGHNKLYFVCVCWVDLNAPTKRKKRFECFLYTKFTWVSHHHRYRDSIDQRKTKKKSFFFLFFFMNSFFFLSFIWLLLPHLVGLCKARHIVEITKKGSARHCQLPLHTHTRATQWNSRKISRTKW